MDTSVSVTAVLFTKDTSCKELLESKPKITRVVAGRIIGFDHGVGHSLLLLYDAKAPYSQNGHDFNGLGQHPFNTLYKFIIN